ncbi:hypothetical protein ACFLTM_02870 [Candidatus Bipolaricaulota bacterium]
MKKVLVFSLIVLGAGAVACAGPISGSAEVCAQFDDTGLTVFGTAIDLDYSISGFVLGATAIFELDEFDNLFITATGTLGTIDIRTMVAFEPLAPAFMAWTGAAQISFGGALVFGYFALLETGGPGDGAYGLGATLGFSSTVGEVTITAATFFNMLNTVYYLGAFGPDWAFTRDVYQHCGTWYTPFPFPYAVPDTGCSLSWSGAAILADFPFACLDVTAFSMFLESGDVMAGFILAGIETGIAWLDLSQVAILFAVDEKTVFLDWGVVLGDLVCVMPYVSLDRSALWSIDGITLNALLLEYNYNGVTVKAGEIFDPVWADQYVLFYTSDVAWGFTLDGGLASEIAYLTGGGCIYNLAYDEFFGIWIDGDSCCGGAYDINIISFFDTGTGSTLFDWQETVATLEVGIGPSVSIKLMMSLMTDGLNWFQLCGIFNF